MHHHSDCLGRRILLYVLLMFFVAPVQAALLFGNAGVLYDEGDGSGDHQVNVATGATSVAGYSSTIVPGLAVAAYGDAQYGALHASSSAGTIGIGPAGPRTRTSSAGSASWLDLITIPGHGLTGAAFARVPFSLTGGLNSLSDLTIIGSQANSTVNMTIQVDGARVFLAEGQAFSRNGVFEILTPGSQYLGTFYFDIPFIFDQPFQLFASLSAQTQASAGVANAMASADSVFDHTATWGGISDVHRADGTLLSGYTLSSQSGFNWLNAFGPVTAPVPEPETYAMLLAGLGLLGFAARRRKLQAK